MPAKKKTAAKTVAKKSAKHSATSLEISLMEILGQSEFSEIVSRLGDKDQREDVLSGIAIKANTRFPQNEAARDTWAAIIFLNRAAIRTPEELKQRFLDAVDDVDLTPAK